jgi:hypothetical protein
MLYALDQRNKNYIGADGTKSQRDWLKSTYYKENGFFNCSLIFYSVVGLNSNLKNKRNYGFF